MSVYFIKPIGMDGPIKIGTSAQPCKRMSGLDSWSPFPLELVATIDGDVKVERRFHAMFLHLHQRREWFEAGDDLLAVIDQINAEAFDLATLPPPRRVDGMNLHTRSEASRLQTSYSIKVSHMERKTGLLCPVSVYDIVKNKDSASIARVDAYLSDPQEHGVAA